MPGIHKVNFTAAWVLATAIPFVQALDRPRPQPKPPILPQDELKPPELIASKEQPKDGPVYTLVQSEVQLVSLGLGLRQLCPSPDGKEIYAIYDGSSQIRVLAPSTLTETRTFQSAMHPCHIWCDRKNIAVACDYSKVLQLFDAETKRLLHSFSIEEIKDHKGYWPHRTFERSPDGQLLVGWVKKQEKEPYMSVYSVPDTGILQTVFHTDTAKGPTFWVDYPKRILTQDDSTDASAKFWTVDKFANADGAEAEYPDFLKNHTIFRIYKSRDGQRLYLVAATMKKHQEAITYVTDKSIEQLFYSFPGAYIDEPEGSNYLVAYFTHPLAPGRTRLDPEIYFIDKSNGQLIRKIVPKMEDGNNVLYWAFEGSAMVAARNGFRRPVFIPNQELYIIKKSDTYGNSGASTGLALVVACGPLEGAVKGDPIIAVPNDPPLTAHVGKLVEYTPNYRLPQNARSIEFRLKDGPEGTNIDPKTGKFTWTPTAVYLGKYAIEIVAVVDGKELPVLSWILQVAP